MAELLSIAREGACEARLQWREEAVSHHAGVTSERGYWEWREEQLAHPDGRAKGGESCVICGQPVPPEADWRHRDRHVCSSDCNYKLSRRFNRRREKGEVTPPPVPVDPHADRPPLVFRTVPEAEFPYEFLGWSPRIGDVVERHGSVTTYIPITYPPEQVAAAEALIAEADPREAAWRRKMLTHTVSCLHLNSGSMQLTTMSDTGTLERVVNATILPSGEQGSALRPFRHDGQEWIWHREFFRHSDDGVSEYTWEAAVCLPYPVPEGLAQTRWTPAYTERSQRLRRISSQTARDARRIRLRGSDGTIERIDPRAVYERDGWICQLCRQPIDPDCKAPDLESASLDHRTPLAAGGSHTYDNVQAAHLGCNVRKGARH